MFSENITETDEYLPYYEQFLKVIPGRRIVDLGCGSGRDVRYFREAGYDAIGVDISSGLVDLCK
ncbi:MAG: class I SAM-dependent methyltransferase [Patescibacteria group bacterium]